MQPRLKQILLLAALGLGLSGCVYYPAPGYYSYGQPYYPYYYGPPVGGGVVIGGHWR